MGKGFLFEARQQRFTFDEEHFFVDLVLYNRLLHCYVLVDLKIGKLTHQDLGQMQMYVNYFDSRSRSAHLCLSILVPQRARATNGIPLEATSGSLFGGNHTVGAHSCRA